LATYAHNYLSEKNDLEIAIDHLKQMKSYDNKLFKTHIDIIIYGFNCLSIHGWAVIDKRDNFDKIYLKIELNNTVYYFKLAFDKRRDIQRKFNSTNKKLGFKGDLQILGINGSIVPFSILFVKDNEFVEAFINWRSFYKISLMGHLRRFLHYIR
jgi:hypothetical protein